MAGKMLIYKYYRPDQTYFFDNFMVRFTQPDALNDPFECFPRLINDGEEIIRADAIREKSRNVKSAAEKKKTEHQLLADIDRAVTMHRKNPDVLKLMLLRDLLRGWSVGVFSASKTIKNILLWSHYAESHSGFAVAFDSEHDFFKKNGIGTRKGFQDVKYENKRARFDFLKMGIEPDIFYIKSPDWEYEQEIRMIRDHKEADKVDRDRQGNPVYLFKVPSQAVKQVIFGYKSSPARRREIERKITGVSELSHVEFFGMQPNSELFQVELKNYSVRVP